MKPGRRDSGVELSGSAVSRVTRDSTAPLATPGKIFCGDVTARHRRPGMRLPAEITVGVERPAAAAFRSSRSGISAASVPNHQG